MIIDLVLFPLFLCFIYCVGAGTLKFADRKNTNAYPDYFHLIAGLITIGFISVSVNFYTGVFSKITYCLIALIFSIGVVTTYKGKAVNLLNVILLGCIITPFAATISAGYDTGLYHIPHQMWIRDEKAVFGLANFNAAFGFSSIMEYINAPLWFYNEFKLLAYSQASFIIIFLLFIRQLSNSKNYYSELTALLIVASLVFFAGNLKTDFSSTDIPMGVLFSITFLHGLHLLLKNEKIFSPDIFTLLVCGLFTSLLKANGFLILLWISFVLVYLLKNKFLTYIVIIKCSLVPIILGVIWLVRSIIISGCLLFPIKQTCLDLPWSAYNQADNIAKWVTAWARNPKSGLSALENWDWINDWWLKNHIVFVVAIFFMTIMVCSVYRFLFQEKIANFRMILLAALSFILLNLFIWFIKAPNPRFGIGILIIMPGILALLLFGFRKAKNENLLPKAMKICLYAIAIELIVTSIIRSGATFAFYPLTVSEIETTPNGNFGVKPVGENADQCWLAKYCSPNNSSQIIEKDGIKMFQSTGVK